MHTELNFSFSDTPIRRVIATALQSSLQVTNSKIRFFLPPATEKKNILHEKVWTVPE